MEEVTAGKSEIVLESLYSTAGQHVLLTRDEELAIDTEKWRAVSRIAGLLLENESSRRYVALWARNLLEKPPTADIFTNRDYYYLLRREHAVFSANGKSRAYLENLAAGEFKTLLCNDNQESLERSASLTVGLAEVVLELTPPRGVAAALAYWQQHWMQGADIARTRVSSTVAKLLADEVDAYYVARSELVNHNLRLVFSMAGKLQGRLPYEDLVQEGTVGLIRAAEKFDASKGYKFSTYAHNWIMQSIRSANDDLGAIIRFPARVIEQLTSIQRERERTRHTLGREPDNKALAKKCNMSVAQVEKLRALGNRSVSLETKFGNEDGGLSLLDKLSSDVYQSPDREAERLSLQSLLLERLGILKPEERHVIVRRWGLDQLPVSTRQDLSAQMQVSTEWVRRLEVSALKKLSHDKVIRDTRSENHFN